jgi:hypothetical protein
VPKLKNTYISTPQIRLKAKLFLRQIGLLAQLTYHSTEGDRWLQAFLLLEELGSGGSILSSHNCRRRSASPYALSTVYIVGFDPGGKKAFGWAVVRSGNSGNNELIFVASGVCTGAPSAFFAAQSAIPGGKAPTGVGIDSPLFWIPNGDRLSDSVVRTLVCSTGKGVSGTVGHVNSLRGACLVQGIFAAINVHREWPVSKVTEAHPKALLVVSRSAREWIETIGLPTDRDHERDAALAAFSAFNFVNSAAGWQDLARKEADTQKPFFPAGHEVAYYFPNSTN